MVSFDEVCAYFILEIASLSYIQAPPTDLHEGMMKKKNGTTSFWLSSSHTAAVISIFFLSKLHSL